MDTSNNVITTSENRIRKHWLISTASISVIFPLALFVFLCFLSAHITISHDELKDLLREPLVDAFKGSFSMWLIWFCAYRKPGIKLLTVWLIMTPIWMLASTMKCLMESSDLWTVIAILVEFLIFLWWYVLSFKLRAVNKVIKKRPPLITPDLGQA